MRDTLYYQNFVKLAQCCERKFIHNFNPLSGNYDTAALLKQIVASFSADINFKVKLI